MKKTLGGDRLGSGSKIQVELHGYERSTHDLGYLWRSTMSAGTLIPFLTEVALPGDTFDINLDCDIKTHPTVGPLFGSYKVQLDIFQCPIRLYQGQLHNNKLGIGMNMAAIKLPQILLKAVPVEIEEGGDQDNAQINPSCILSYLGIRGVGQIAYPEETENSRSFNALPFLSYWDIYKNYYANKQEEIGAVIHQGTIALVETIDSVMFNGQIITEGPAENPQLITAGMPVAISYTGASPILSQIMVKITNRFFTSTVPITSVTRNMVDDGIDTILGEAFSYAGTFTIKSWNYQLPSQTGQAAPRVQTFDLNAIDEMREEIMGSAQDVTAFIVNAANLAPYNLLLNQTTGMQNTYMHTQEGLALKTYQSDLFNNWLSTEWIDGSGGINEITAISTVGDSFTLDTLNLSKKVYDMLNRIAVSGGTYDDWLDAVYTHDRYQRAETPMYMGGLIKELVFQEVVSNAESTGDQGPQPLGSLAGKGILSKKHKGGKVTIKVDEPSYIMGIISLTPRIDYSQGNKWDTHLLTMDDFHKPALDEIGFQELITEQMAWWSTSKAAIGQPWLTRSAGKQPAWINYMTNVNQTRGNFAVGATVGEMFMTLNRRYEPEEDGDIADLTTYIDPVKFNHIFAQTSIDAQNFWAQIAVDITARRKMSAKVMPNL